MLNFGRWTGVTYSVVAVINTVIQTYTHFLAGFEEGDVFLVNFDFLSGPRIATDPGGAVFDGEGTKSAQLNPVSTHEGLGDLIKNCIHDILDITLVEMRILFGDMLNQLRFDH